MVDSPIYHYQPSYFFIMTLWVYLLSELLWSHVEAISHVPCNGSSIHMSIINGNMLLDTVFTVIRPYLACCGTKVCPDIVVAKY